MITAEEVRKFQAENNKEIKRTRINTHLNTIESCIKTQSYNTDNFIIYGFSSNDPIDEVKEELEKLGYTVKELEVNEYKMKEAIKYKISW